MKHLFFIISISITLSLFGQKSAIENLINQVATDEVPENFGYYFLISKSLEQPKIYDSLQKHQIRELIIPGNDFPIDLIYNQSKETIDWKNYNLKNVKYPEENIYVTSPPIDKDIQFVKYNIDPNKFDSLFKNKKPHTLLVKKKWIWNKKRVWTNKKFYNELVKAEKMDDMQKLEEKVYFQFSKPIFSEDNKYARVSIFKNRRKNGDGFTALYKNENGIWKKIMEYNPVVRTVMTYY